MADNLFPELDIPAKETFAELTVQVNASLNARGGNKRESKQTISHVISSWLLARKRLLRDTSQHANAMPYLLTDDNVAVAITNEGSLPLNKAMAAIGLNATETFFNWLLADLQHIALEQGRDVHLARWSEARNGALYVSAGANQQVKITPFAEPVLMPNGTDNVVFAAESTFPAWEPAEPVPVHGLRGMQLALEAPSEVPDYDANAQRALIESWLVSVMLNIRPLPILCCLGQMGSGKSTLVRVILKILMGTPGDLSPIPYNVRDFNACACAFPVYAIDNLDVTPNPWLVDSLAAAATGGSLQERELYSNASVFQKQMQAALAVTTRTAQFAQRSDIQERLLPVFFGSLSDRQRVADRVIYAEAAEQRNGVLTWLAQQAANTLADTTVAEGFPGRFQEFARIASRDPDEVGRYALGSWVKAQRLSITDHDPLFDAILSYKGEAPLYGTATEIVQILERAGHDVPHMGGGKAISRKLMELRGSLKLAGFSLAREEMRDRSYFTIRAETRGHPVPPIVEKAPTYVEQPF